MYPFGPGGLTASQADRLNEISRQIASLGNITAAAPLGVTRLAGNVTINADGMVWTYPTVYKIVAINSSQSNVPPLYTCTVETKGFNPYVPGGQGGSGTDRLPVDYVPNLVKQFVLGLPGYTYNIGDLVVLFPIPDHSDWWWAIPLPATVTFQTRCISGVNVKEVSNDGGATWQFYSYEGFCGCNCTCTSCLCTAPNTGTGSGYAIPAQLYLMVYSVGTSNCSGPCGIDCGYCQSYLCQVVPFTLQGQCIWCGWVNSSIASQMQFAMTCNSSGQLVLQFNATFGGEPYNCTNRNLYISNVDCGNPRILNVSSCAGSGSGSRFCATAVLQTDSSDNCVSPSDCGYFAVVISDDPTFAACGFGAGSTPCNPCLGSGSGGEGSGSGANGCCSDPPSDIDGIVSNLTQTGGTCPTCAIIDGASIPFGLSSGSWFGTLCGGVQAVLSCSFGFWQLIGNNMLATLIGTGNCDGNVVTAAFNVALTFEGCAYTFILTF